MAKKKKKKIKKKTKSKKVKSVKKVTKKKVTKKTKAKPKKKRLLRSARSDVKVSPKKSVKAAKKVTVRKPSSAPTTTVTKEAWKTPAWGETEVGIVEHFFGEINVAAIKLRKPLKVGDKLHIKGHTTDLSQVVASMQIEHQSVTEAPSGSDIGIKVTDRVREHDIVYRVE